MYVTLNYSLKKRLITGIRNAISTIIKQRKNKIGTIKTGYS